MVKPFYKMTTTRLESIKKRYEEKLMEVKKWTAKNKNLYNRMRTVSNILEERKKPPKLFTIAEMVMSGIALPDSVQKRSAPTPPWKLKHNKYGKTKSNSVQMDTKIGVNKSSKTNRKKLQNQN